MEREVKSSSNVSYKKVKKRKCKKIAFICSILIVLLSITLFSLYYFLGGNYLKLTSDNKDTIEVMVGDNNYQKPKVTCTFLGKKVSKKNIKIMKEIDINKLGEQEVIYECEKSFFKKNVSVKYNVVDKIAPELEVDSEEKVTIYVNDNYNEPIVKAVDNYDGDITDKVEKIGEVDNKKAGTYEIEYKVQDSSGNEISKKIVVEVKTKQVAGSNKGANMSCGEAGVIYLTFDDGPNNYYTPVILDVLKKYNVKATFFVTSAGSDDLIKREFDEGHKVAIHTSSHAYNVVYASEEAFWNDMDIVKERIIRITGVEPTMMRFPGGSSNTVSRHYSIGIMGRLAEQIENKGYAYFDWNISSGDAGETTDPNVEYANVVNTLSKSRGNVVLMHDIKKHTSEAIESIVKYGIDNGYTFDVLNNSIVCHQPINN
ncbi:MAG: polysaccharide deacetylase family protein [Bacilli bacterium]|nr:polysaccharide deacetylase family protein [Bacilli bacterium]